jgi:hypothetical protein
MSDQQPITDDRQAFARDWLFRHGAPLRFGTPWSFLPACEHIRGPIRARRRVLASLCAQFAEPMLLQAGFAERPPDGDLRLAAALTCRGGAVIALQSGAEEPPWDLLVAGGLLSGVGHPVLSALQDCRIRDRARERGVVIAAGNIQSVALLTALGLPATLGTGLHRLTLDEMRRLDNAYGEGLPHFEFEVDAGPDGNSADGTDSTEAGAVEDQSDGKDKKHDGADDFAIDFPPSPPALLLADWDPFELCSTPQSWIRHAAVRLAEVRRNAGLPLGGICVWRPHEETAVQIDRLAAISQKLEASEH